MILFKFKKEIKGEATTKGFEGWLNASSMQFGVGRSVSSPSGGTGKRNPMGGVVAGVVVVVGTAISLGIKRNVVIPGRQAHRVVVGVGDFDRAGQG